MSALNENNECRYLNFPITLLRGQKQPFQLWYDVLAYCIFYQASNNELCKSVIDIEQKVGVAFDFLQVFEVEPEYQLAVYQHGADVHDSIAGNKDAFTSIKSEMMVEYCLGERNKKDFEFLLYFLAVKSILGRKRYASASWHFVVCRMAGFTKCVDSSMLPQRMRVIHNSRHYMRKYRGLILQRFNYTSKPNSNNRGFVFSSTLSSQELREVIYQNNESRLIKERLAKERKEDKVFIESMKTKAAKKLP